MLEDLQEAVILSLKFPLVLWLENTFVTNCTAWMVAGLLVHSNSDEHSQADMNVMVIDPV